MNKGNGKPHARVCMQETSGFVLMLEPKEKCDSHAAAKELAACIGVDKVYMTSGSCGLMVHGHDTLALNAILTKASRFGNASNFVIRHIEYAKKR